jgi:hypothetical protein
MCVTGTQTDRVLSRLPASTLRNGKVRAWRAREGWWAARLDCSRAPSTQVIEIRRGVADLLGGSKQEVRA